MGYEPGHLCPRCRTNIVPNTAPYCPSCWSEYQKERKAGQHQRERTCSECGAPFGGKAGSSLCPACRMSSRERVCSECGATFVGTGASLLCPTCRQIKNRESSRKYSREHRIERRERLFGLASGEWQLRLDRQGCCCAICGGVLDPDNGQAANGACLDHDHACCDWSPFGDYSAPVCGRCNRDLLCRTCNLMIGLAKDDPGRLRQAIVYLERWAAVRSS